MHQLSFPGGRGYVEPEARSRAVRKGRGKRPFQQQGHLARANDAVRSLTTAIFGRRLMLWTSLCLGFEHGAFGVRAYTHENETEAMRQWSGFPAYSHDA